MGNFSVSCSISKLSINSGDKCAIIPIFRNSFAEEYNPICLCGPGDRYLPLTLPIIGYYDDYGGIESIERNENTLIIEEYFGISIEEFVQIINYHNYEKVKDKEKRQKLSNVFFMYVLYDVYEYSVYNFRNLSYTKELELIDKFRTDINKCNDELAFCDYLNKYSSEVSSDAIIASMKYKIENLFPFLTGRAFQYNNDSFINIYLRTVFNGNKFYSPSDFMLKEFVDFYYFVISMIYTNSIFDIVRQGTQYGETKTELQNMKFYCSILEKRLKQEQKEDY